ncbi:MAG: hypothetical protein KF767_08750 [Bdellovibrionaceae bacterium]|nr:hypothetical protein [Pseudobdellovibrionaceae bacterium]
MSKKEFGKIKSAEFGACGYQEACLGVRLTLGGESWGVRADITGGWDVVRSESAQWTEDDRIKAHGEMCLKLSAILKDAKVNSVSRLVGIPIEAEFDGTKLVNWRVMKEVL